jgi:hypothetical protein
MHDQNIGLRKQVVFEYIQGVSKFLEPFVFVICSKSLGAQKKTLLPD